MLRASGPASEAALVAMAGGAPAPRRASLRVLRDGAGEELDRAIVLWFPGPASYTGEDCFELHLHGGVAVLDGVTSSLSALGLRPASPGEFTRRAVTSGRMDLLAAEAVADIIDAETALQRKQALAQLGGEVSAIYTAWSKRLLHLLAQQEALIDFPDEALPPEVEAALLSSIADLARVFDSYLKQSPRGERLRTGLVFAIVGPPNVGKSSLINALAGRDVAIVSAQPGTTRDVLEARIEIAGVPVTLLDTAGLREASDAIEIEGIRRAHARMATADYILVLHEATALSQEFRNARPLALEQLDANVETLVVATKIDLVLDFDPRKCGVSTRTGVGLDDVVRRLEAQVRRLAGAGDTSVFSRARHRSALADATRHLDAAIAAPWPELRGEELRLAHQAVGRITGAAGVEEVLDSVFSQFCIGK